MFGYSSLIFIVSICVGLVSCYDFKDKVVHAINCGGDDVMGAYGILYKADTLTEGNPSDFGMQFPFYNTDPEDFGVYQTERWHDSDFQYTIPMKKEGNFVLMLKFSEVYFQKENQKVFDVSVNGHKILKNLDIYKEAGGRGFAYDVYIQLKIEKKSLIIDDKSLVFDGNIELKFEKGELDNPKVNAFAIIEGEIEDMPPKPKTYSEYPIEDKSDDDVIDHVLEEVEDEVEVIDDQQGEEYDASVAHENTNPYEEETEYDMYKIGTAVVAVVLIALAIRKYLDDGEEVIC